MPAGTGGGADQMAGFLQGVIAKHNLMKQPLGAVNLIDKAPDLFESPFNRPPGCPLSFSKQTNEGPRHVVSNLTFDYPRSVSGPRVLTRLSRWCR